MLSPRRKWFRPFLVLAFVVPLATVFVLGTSNAQPGFPKGFPPPRPMPFPPGGITPKFPTGPMAPPFIPPPMPPFPGPGVPPMPGFPGGPIAPMPGVPGGPFTPPPIIPGGFDRWDISCSRCGGTATYLTKTPAFCSRCSARFTSFTDVGGVPPGIAPPGMPAPGMPFPGPAPFIPPGMPAPGGPGLPPGMPPPGMPAIPPGMPPPGMPGGPGLGPVKYTVTCTGCGKTETYDTRTPASCKACRRTFGEIRDANTNEVLKSNGGMGGGVWATIVAGGLALIGLIAAAIKTMNS